MTPDPSAAVARPIAAVGVVCLKDECVLLIRRGAPPRLGEWSIPGGKVEWGERAAEAALRELREETGVDAALIGLVDVVDGIFTSRATGETTRHYVLIDYAARWVSGEPRAGDDAAEACFVPLGDIQSLGLWAETLRVIAAAAALSAATAGEPEPEAPRRSRP